MRIGSCLLVIGTWFNVRAATSSVQRDVQTVFVRRHAGTDVLLALGVFERQ